MPLISFEGAEGSGKSTQVTLLANHLGRLGMTTHVFREPGGTRVGEAIRNWLQHSEDGEGIAAQTELLLFEASRSELVRQKIQPALDRGEWVICDRFFDSTTVYQGAARQLDPALVTRLNVFAADRCIPNITFLLDIDFATMEARIRNREVHDRIEREPEQFHQRVIDGYRKLAAAQPSRIVLIDGGLSTNAIESRIWDVMCARFPTLNECGQRSASHR